MAFKQSKNPRVLIWRLYLNLSDDFTSPGVHFVKMINILSMAKIDTSFQHTHRHNPMHDFLIVDKKFYIEVVCGDKLAFWCCLMLNLCVILPHTPAPYQFLTTFVFITFSLVTTLSSVFKFDSCSNQRYVSTIYIPITLLNGLLRMLNNNMVTVKVFRASIVY